MSGFITYIERIRLRDTEPRPPNPQQQSPLFNLPREVRDECYAHLLADLHITKLDVRHVDLAIPGVLTLTATCQLLRAELKDALRTRAVQIIRDLSVATFIYPFTPGAWASDLPAKDHFAMTAIRPATPSSAHAVTLSLVLRARCSRSGVGFWNALVERRAYGPCRAHSAESAGLGGISPVYVPVVQV